MDEAEAQHEFLISAAGVCVYDMGGRFCGEPRQARVHQGLPPVDLEGFMAHLTLLLQDRESFHVLGYEVVVDRVDSRTLGAQVGTQRFLIDVETVDERPDPGASGG
jgi:hypothetical protein